MPAPLLSTILCSAAISEKVDGLLEYSDTPEAAEYLQSRNSWPPDSTATL